MAFFVDRIELANPEPAGAFNANFIPGMIQVVRCNITVTSLVGMLNDLSIAANNEA